MSLVRTAWNSVARLLSLCRRHLFVSAIILIVVFYGGFRVFAAMTSSAGETTYTLGTAASSTIIASVSATGQIAASDQIDIQPKVSGEITWVGVQAGQKVADGQALFQIDSTDAQDKVAQAQQSLATARLQYQHDAAQAPLDYQKAQDTLNQDVQTLADDYVDTYNALSTTYLDLPAVVTGTQDALYGYEMSPNKSQANTDILTNLFQNDDARTQATQFSASAKSDYQAARASYDSAIAIYKMTSRTSDAATLESLLQTSIDMATLTAQSVQSELNFLNTVSDLAQQYGVQLPSYFNTLVSNERGYLATANTEESDLLAQKKTLANAKQAVKTDQQSISLLQVGNSSDGTNPISLQESAANIAADEQNLAQLKQDLADYTVRAPFGGTIASVSAVKGDNASGALASIITTQQIAQLSVNEVDAAKIRVGEKASLTFDAIDGLTLTGRVASVDTVGTVSQGVVSYTVKITLDTQDERVKPGMTVNASIITDTRTDVLSVPSSAVKTAGGRSYVLAFQPPVQAATLTTRIAPAQIPVTTGISDDTNVEITSGLTWGTQIVIRSSNSTQAAAGASGTGASGAGFRGGGGFGGGGAIRL